MLLAAIIYLLVMVTLFSSIAFIYIVKDSFFKKDLVITKVHEINS